MTLDDVFLSLFFMVVAVNGVMLGFRLLKEGLIGTSVLAVIMTATMAFLSVSVVVNP